MSFLDDLKSGAASVLDTAGNVLGNAVDAQVNSVLGSTNTPASGNKAPAPDVAAIAARAQAGLTNMASSKFGGIPLPLLLVGVLALGLIVMRKK